MLDEQFDFTFKIIEKDINYGRFIKPGYSFHVRELWIILIQGTAILLPLKM